MFPINLRANITTFSTHNVPLRFHTATLKGLHPTNNIPRNLSRPYNPVLNAVDDDTDDVSRSIQPYLVVAHWTREKVISGSGGTSQGHKQYVHFVVGSRSNAFPLRSPKGPPLTISAKIIRWNGGHGSAYVGQRKCLTAKSELLSHLQET
jgi:hypothetical protein